MIDQAFETFGYLWPLLLAGAVIVAVLVIADVWWRRDDDEGDPIGDPSWLPAAEPEPRHRGNLPEDGTPAVVLIGFTVWGHDERDRQESLMALLPPGDTGVVEDWWIAEDTRYDRNDNESAVFVPRHLTQVDARRLLEQARSGSTTWSRWS